MSKSLLDQLNKLGLVNEQQVKMEKNQKHKAAKKKTKNIKNNDADKKSLSEEVKEKKLAKDKELNAKKALIQKKHEAAAQISQIIETYKIDHSQGDIRFNFSDGGKVQRLYITTEHHHLLSKGKLAIIKFEKMYSLVPFEAAEKILQRDAAAVVFINNASANEKVNTSKEEEDPYADYQIPDDLMW